MRPPESPYINIYEQQVNIGVNYPKSNHMEFWFTFNITETINFKTSLDLFGHWRVSNIHQDSEKYSNFSCSAMCKIGRQHRLYFVFSGNVGNLTNLDFAKKKWQKCSFIWLFHIIVGSMAKNYTIILWNRKGKQQRTVRKTPLHCRDEGFPSLRDVIHAIIPTSLWLFAADLGLGLRLGIWAFQFMSMIHEHYSCRFIWDRHEISDNQTAWCTINLQLQRWSHWMRGANAFKHTLHKLEFRRFYTSNSTYRVVQLKFTPEIEVLYMLLGRSLPFYREKAGTLAVYMSLFEGGWHPSYKWML